MGRIVFAAHSELVRQAEEYRQVESEMSLVELGTVFSAILEIQQENPNVAIQKFDWSDKHQDAWEIVRQYDITNDQLQGWGDLISSGMKERSSGLLSPGHYRERSIETPRFEEYGPELQTTPRQREAESEEPEN